MGRGIGRKQAGGGKKEAGLGDRQKRKPHAQPNSHTQVLKF